MFYWIDGDRIAARWSSLPANWRDPETGDIFSRVPVGHPKLRIGVQGPAPGITPPFQRLQRADGFYDPETDTVTEGWTIETLPLEQARLKARAIVNAERDRRVAEGIELEVGETTVRVETRDVSDFNTIASLVQLAQMRIGDGTEAAAIVYRGVDDVTVELTPVQAIDLGLAVAAARSAAYRWAWAVKDTIAQAESLEELVAALRKQNLL